MPNTFNFEELDSATHDYLVAVRECEGRGSPGIFVATSDWLPGCGLIAGPIIIILTLLGTLIPTSMLLTDPLGLAALQTAGLLLGGWLLMAKFRLGSPSNKIAGNWIYVDPLYVYEAYREQITITRVDEVIEARVTANYNNDAYTNSTLEIRCAGRQYFSFTIQSEKRAEQIRVFLNYLAWARGPDGDARADLPAATLGGLAKYVAKTGDEPKNAENDINLDLIELDITEVPEEPTREGRSLPSLLPYILLHFFAAVCFFVMGFVINPWLRDDEIFTVVTMKPVEPRNLRAYLIDSRNTKHREEVTQLLSKFYDDPAAHVRKNGENAELREGMAQILESVRTVANPVVSVRVTELNTPAGKETGKAEREQSIRTQFVKVVNAEFSKQQWGQPISIPGLEPGDPKPPPIGEQLLAYVEKPDDVDHAHFEITYSMDPGVGQSRLTITVELRTNVTEEPTKRATIVIPGVFDAASIDVQVPRIVTELVKAMVGQTDIGQPAGPQLPQGFPNFGP
jgi:hypothetical protein